MSIATQDLITLGQRPTLGRYLKAIWERREFAVSLPLGALRAQNMDTVLGTIWHLLNPLLLAGVYYLVFGVILRVGNRGTDNFVAFLIVGMFVFFYTRKSVQAGARTIVANNGLIRAIRFPRAILPLSAVVGETIVLGPTVAVMLLIVLASGEAISPAWLLLVPAFALQAAFNLGLAMAVARLTDHFRDVQHFLPYLMSIWLYMSGIFFVADAFIEDKALLALFKTNPMYIFTQLARDALLHHSADSQLWLTAGAWSCAALVIGFWYFLRREQDYGRG